MALAFGNKAEDAGLNKKVLNHTVESGCTLLLFLTNTGYSDVSAPTAVSSDVGGALTLLDSNVSGGRGPQIWYLVSPAVGAHVLTATYTNSNYITLTSLSILDSATSSIFGTVAKAGPTSSTAATVNVSSASGELVIDCCTWRKASGDLTATVGAGQTQVSNLSSGTGTTQNLGLVSTEPGATTVTMSWTGTLANFWYTMGVSIRPAAAGGGGSEGAARHYYTMMQGS